jgi:hypothetical protein
MGNDVVLWRPNPPVLAISGSGDAIGDATVLYVEMDATGRRKKLRLHIRTKRIINLQLYYHAYYHLEAQILLHCPQDRALVHAHFPPSRTHRSTSKSMCVLFDRDFFVHALPGPLGGSWRLLAPDGG